MHFLSRIRCNRGRGFVRGYSDSTVFPWERSKLPELLVSTSSHFKTNEYAILDDVLDKNDAICIREEIQKLKAGSNLTQNCTFLWDPSTRTNILFPKSKILEYDYYSESLSKGVDVRSENTPFVDSLSKDALLCRMLNVIWGRPILISKSDDVDISDPQNVLERQAVKLQYNQGDGGCFPIHFDSDPSVDSRFLTCILYLNDAQDIKGGELVLYPYSSEPITIEPILNRMVIFKSQSMAHRVLPSFSERYCITLWCSTAPCSTPAEPNNKDIQEIMERYVSEKDDAKKCSMRKSLLEHPYIRRHVLKFIHQDSWRRSIEESHDVSDNTEKMKQLFDEEIKVIERVLGPILLNAVV